MIIDINGSLTLLERAQEIQKEMHNVIDQFKKQLPGISYENAAMMFLYMKIAELEEEIRQLRLK